MSPARRGLITAHWFRQGPDPLEGYWICDFHGCGRHRSDHVQAEGHWRAEPHPFTPQRRNSPRCYTCGGDFRQSRHIAWTWDRYGALLQDGVPAAGACAVSTENVVGQKEGSP
ncbi:hypothetical protein GCM10010329_85880 [Streptomyces spiroverticillatus]|uniref:Uncharacterized protein n=1 Tax=Streptomyces finlayi TaxID=67296 RepID=A0A918X9Q5_9ACTN|nr:hypothetical protein [Streptomyces finlayi]GHA50719.1 hypothetical protein GCM10010329_85880 [Streptomyces spiroverticillatus]GHD19949.1 hypothetical protein GCM10010334_84010 [Streptomyces finlayi]